MILMLDWMRRLVCHISEAAGMGNAKKPQIRKTRSWIVEVRLIGLSAVIMRADLRHARESIWIS
jgi:hypothetical protein